MTTALTRTKRALMGVPEKEIVAFKRGDTANWRHLESAVRAAVGGYHAVLDGGSLREIVERLDRFPLDLRGYAYEGCAMGLTGLDTFLPGSRFQEFLNGPGDAHPYMAHNGAGEALARLRRRPEPFIAKLDDPVLRWLVMDGYGFHQGFFAPARYVERQHIPSFLSPYARRVFDQGVGRSIWFLSGADVDRVAARIAAFAPRRQSDLWLGVGIACGYVGGVDREQVEHLRDVSVPYLTHVATGAAFTAKGRLRAGNPIPDADVVCDVLCGIDGNRAAEIVDDAFGYARLPSRVGRPGYALLQDYMLGALSASYPSVDAGSPKWN